MAQRIRIFKNSDGEHKMVSLKRRTIFWLVITVLFLLIPLSIFFGVLWHQEVIDFLQANSQSFADWLDGMR